MKTKFILGTMGIILFLSLFGFDVMAGTGGTAFDGFYAEVAGWLTGAPGKTIMVLMFLGSAFYSVIEPNFIRAAAAAIFGLILANATEMIEAFLSATLVMS
jgi:hypothetical protein